MLEAPNNGSRSVLQAEFADPPKQALLSPRLVEALTELANTEDLPVAALIALLLNEALSRRLRRGRS
jgi:hypothetical protein